ncbi:MAG: hypothetical protein GF398_08155 [Chitinivibrionales bacterium]|nr:hypothetical protein [Chitinivibrionales bacterium]
MNDRKKITMVTRNGNTHRTTDGGQTWSDLGGKWAGTGVAAIGLDADGGGAEGWFARATSGGSGRQYISVFISRDPTSKGSEVLKCRERHERNGDACEDADPSFFQSSDHLLHLTFSGRSCPILKHYVIDPYVLTGAAATAAKSHPAMRQNSSYTVSSRNNAVHVAFSRPLGVSARVSLFSVDEKMIATRMLAAGTRDITISGKRSAPSQAGIVQVEHRGTVERKMLARF